MSSESPEQRSARRRPKAVFFSRDDVPVTPVEPQNLVVPEPVRPIFEGGYYVDRMTTRHLLSVDTESGGYHFTETTATPGTVVGRHTHNWDQVVFILEGSMRQGNKILEAGSGYFMPAGYPYGFVVGPEGARWLEFHTQSYERGSTTILEDEPDRWKDGPRTAERSA